MTVRDRIAESEKRQRASGWVSVRELCDLGDHDLLDVPIGEQMNLLSSLCEKHGYVYTFSAPPAALDDLGNSGEYFGTYTTHGDSETYCDPHRFRCLIYRFANEEQAVRARLFV